MINKIIRFFLNNTLITISFLMVLVVWGLISSPFQWKPDFLPSHSISVDALPDIGENQQIVYTKWMGRSPQDIDDQITYPLTTSLLGIPGVKSIRSSSIFGVSSIYIIFEEDIEFYWSRSRILEKLNSLPSNLLPDGVKPALGPDATALGQVFWYTIEGRDQNGNPTGGWDLHEIRTVQDFYVKYGLNAVNGVSEVSSIGGYVQEYQIDVNPDLLKLHNIGLEHILKAVKESNTDVGAKTIEINRAEYLVRGIGYIKSISDLENTAVAYNHDVPVFLKDIAKVHLGPATRRGLLDKDGAEVVGGVVISRYGANPMEVIQRIKAKIQDISPGLPTKTLANGKVSQLTIVPFYDRSQLITETLSTLEEALTLEMIITIIVVIVLMLNLKNSILISSILPISVLFVFIGMKFFNIEANIVALSGIAIAIGTMIDLGIVLSENIVKHLENNKTKIPLKELIYQASSEVSSAIVVAVSTTIISFIPVFTLEAAEGKLFQPLAYTKTFALIAALLVTLFILPTLANWIFGFKLKITEKIKVISALILGIIAFVFAYNFVGFILISFWIFQYLSWKKQWFSNPKWQWIKSKKIGIALVFFGVMWFLNLHWMPLGFNKPVWTNFLFVFILVSLILFGFFLLEKFYSRILTWCLNHKTYFLILPFLVILFGINIWFGFQTTFGFMAKSGNLVNLEIEKSSSWQSLSKTFPGMGKEFMPSLNEGTFLLMPSSMPHAGMAENKKVIQQLDMLLANIPEVDLSVGKLGRIESALDPAPISMYENIVNYKSEYVLNSNGQKQKYKVHENGNFMLSDNTMVSQEEFIKSNISSNLLIEDEEGEYVRNWRDHIQNPDDIWNEIVKVTKIPGVTSAPKLQPIETRLIMLQTGMRAPMGIKVYGPDLQTIDKFGQELERALKQIPSVKKEAIFADRIVGKPYIHLNINRQAIARYGLSVQTVQNTIEASIGGKQVTSTVEGRQRFPVTVRYPRELRDNPEALKNIYVNLKNGTQIPLSELVDIEYIQGPQMIKSEETFLVGYVLFDKMHNKSEIDVVNDVQDHFKHLIEQGDLKVPNGVSYKFSGNYENQVRAEKRLSLIVPLVLLIIFMILYLLFKSVTTSLMVFTGIAMAFAGGFIMFWLFGQEWFMNFNVFDTSLRDLFQMKTINLSVAVWVGFIALFGIATDDGVLIGSYLDSSFKSSKPKTVHEIKEAVITAGKRRIKPAIMTSASTIIALLPILTSTGKGSDIMIPMAIPAFGGMIVACITYFIIPVLYSFREEYKLKKTAL
ncbi:MAG: efflux RND transporter permease subunit [Flavobacteriales bacterium]